MRKNKIFLIIPIVLTIAVIVAAIVYYMGYYIKSEQIYNRLVNKGLNLCATIAENLDYNTYKSNTTIKISLDANNSKINPNTLDLINKLDTNIVTQINKQNKNLNLDFNFDYNKKDLLNLKTYIDLDRKETNIYLKDLLNKYLKIELNEKYYNYAEEIFKLDKESINNIIENIRNNLPNIINKKNTSSSKEKLIIDGKFKKVNKATLKIKLSEILSATKYKDIENIPNANNIEVEFNVYTSDILRNDIVKIEINIYDIEETMKVSIIDDKYYFELLSNDLNLKTEIDIKTKTENEGVIRLITQGDINTILEVNYIQEYNSTVETINITNSGNVQDLSKDEQVILLDNFKKSELYKLIENFVNKKKK